MRSTGNLSSENNKRQQTTKEKRTKMRNWKMIKEQNMRMRQRKNDNNKGESKGEKKKTENMLVNP